MDAGGIQALDDDQDLNVTEEEASVMQQENIHLFVVNKKQLNQDRGTKIAYRYLFWACMRGQIFIANYVINEFGISPFLAEKAEEKSPFHVAIENNQERIVKMILRKNFIHADMKLIEQ